MHEADESFRYRGRDDGGTLTLTVERPPVSDGGTADVDIVLVRSGEGFVGEVRGRAVTPSGRICPVAFPTELKACADGGIVLRSAERAAVDEWCRPVDAGEAPPMREHRLIRAVAPDGGLAQSELGPDAGGGGANPPFGVFASSPGRRRSLW